MLLVGTKQGLLDLDTGHTFVDGHYRHRLGTWPQELARTPGSARSSSASTTKGS